MSSKRSSKSRRIHKPEAVLLDIDGTTTDIGFVTKILFPIIRSNFEMFLSQTYYSSDTKDLIQRLRILSNSGNYNEMPIIVVGTKEQVIRSVADNVKWQMHKNKQTTELKLLELLCWQWAYDNHLIKAHIYDDVSPSLHNWKTKANIKIYTFSSGMTLAQKLLFVNTIHGNIHSLIDDFFDISIGSKTDLQSYKLISNIIGVEVNKILFITDDPKEAKTAISAGLQSVIIKRPGNKATEEYSDIPRINSFEEIKF